MREGGVPRFRDLAEDETQHARAGRQRVHVGVPVAHPDAVGGVERHVEGADEDLAVLEGRDGLFLKDERVVLDDILRALVEIPVTGFRFHPSLPLCDRVRGIFSTNPVTYRFQHAFLPR